MEILERRKHEIQPSLVAVWSTPITSGKEFVAKTIDSLNDSPATEGWEVEVVCSAVNGPPFVFLEADEFMNRDDILDVSDGAIVRVNSWPADQHRSGISLWILREEGETVIQGIFCPNDDQDTILALANATATSDL